MKSKPRTTGSPPIVGDAVFVANSGNPDIWTIEWMDPSRDVMLIRRWAPAKRRPWEQKAPKRRKKS